MKEKTRYLMWQTDNIYKKPRLTRFDQITFIKRHNDSMSTIVCICPHRWPCITNCHNKQNNKYPLMTTMKKILFCFFLIDNSKKKKIIMCNFTLTTIYWSSCISSCWCLRKVHQTLLYIHYLVRCLYSLTILHIKMRKETKDIKKCVYFCLRRKKYNWIFFFLHNIY